MENNIMTDKSKHKVITTYASPFLNADNLFVEYDDVIKSPFFVYLTHIQNNELLKTVFNTSEIVGLSIDELYEWYITRKERNIFLNFPLSESVMEEMFKNDINAYRSECDTLLESTINFIPEICINNVYLNFHKILEFAIQGKIIKNIYIYYPTYCENIKEDINRSYGGSVKYVYGNLEEVLKENDITNNSTFVFSDINKINTLKKLGLLNLSSVIIADKYSYNYSDSNEPLINMDDLLKKNTFKIDFFDNINTYETAEDPLEKIL